MYVERGPLDLIYHDTYYIMMYSSCAPLIAQVDRVAAGCDGWQGRPMSAPVQAEDRGGMSGLQHDLNRVSSLIEIPIPTEAYVLYKEMRSMPVRVYVGMYLV